MISPLRGRRSASARCSNCNHSISISLGETVRGEGDEHYDRAVVFKQERALFTLYPATGTLF